MRIALVLSLLALGSSCIHVGRHRRGHRPVIHAPRYHCHVTDTAPLPELGVVIEEAPAIEPLEEFVERNAVD